MSDYFKYATTGTDDTNRLVELAVHNERDRVMGLILDMRLYDKRSNSAVNADRFKILTLIRMGVEPGSDEVRNLLRWPNEEEQQS